MIRTGTCLMSQITEQQANAISIVHRSQLGKAGLRERPLIVGTAPHPVYRADLGDADGSESEVGT